MLRATVANTAAVRRAGCRAMSTEGAMSFQLTEDQQSFKELARQFVANEVIPTAAE